MVSAEVLNSHTMKTLRGEISKQNIKGFWKKGMTKPELVALMMKPEHVARFNYIKMREAKPKKEKAPPKPKKEKAPPKPKKEKAPPKVTSLKKLSTEQKEEKKEQAFLYGEYLDARMGNMKKYLKGDITKEKLDDMLDKNQQQYLELSGRKSLPAKSNLIAKDNSNRLEALRKLILDVKNQPSEQKEEKKEKAPAKAKKPRTAKQKANDKKLGEAARARAKAAREAKKN